MKYPLRNYWEIKLTPVKAALERNNFEVFIAENAEEATRIIRQKILPKLKDIRIISRGDSLTFEATGVMDVIRESNAFEFLDPFEAGLIALNSSHYF